MHDVQQLAPYSVFVYRAQLTIVDVNDTRVIWRVYVPENRNQVWLASKVRYSLFLFTLNYVQAEHGRFLHSCYRHALQTAFATFKLPNSREKARGYWTRGAIYWHNNLCNIDFY